MRMPPASASPAPGVRVPPSSAASASFCPLHQAGACHSCPHQDLQLPTQLARKQAAVAALLAGGVNPVPATAWEEPAASAPHGFRNKAKMVVLGTAAQPILGILGPGGTGVDLRHCPLHVPAIQQALPVLAEHITRLRLRPYDIARREGELKHVLVTASPDGDLMARFVLRSTRAVPPARASAPALREALPALAVLSANIQPVHQAILEGPEEVLLTEGPGEDRLLMRLRLDGPAGDARELPLYLPTRSFFQTNTGVAEQLYATAARWARRSPAPTRIWDLFCGVGGFALALAGEGRTVRGVEVSEQAILGARDSASLMGLSAREASFEAGDATVLDPGSGPAPDLLVVNPPRRGIGAELAARIEASGVARVLYSSCNPASLASDLAHMPSLAARRARLFDMFPHTDHAEVLVELGRRA